MDNAAIAKDLNYFGPFISMHKWVVSYLPFQDVHVVNIG